MKPQASTPNAQRLEICAFLTSIFQKTNVVQDNALSWIFSFLCQDKMQCQLALRRQMVTLGTFHCILEWKSLLEGT